MRNADMTQSFKAWRTKTHHNPARAIVLSILVGLLASCAVGPDFNRPTPPDVSSYTTAPLPAQTTSATTALGEVQRFAVGANVDAQWWRTLGSPRLDALIE